MGDTLPHDMALLDQLFVAGQIFDGTVWRMTQAGRDPLKGSNLQGRWRSGDNAVLYTACSSEGAFAEIGFRLSLEPIWPSRLKYVLHEIRVASKNVVDLSDHKTLEKLGLDMTHYRSLDYTLTNRISAAAAFLEFDAMLVPNARHGSSNNLIIFTDRKNDLELLSSAPVNWDTWRKKNSASSQK